MGTAASAYAACTRLFKGLSARLVVCYFAVASSFFFDARGGLQSLRRNSLSTAGAEHETAPVDDVAPVVRTSSMLQCSCARCLAYLRSSANLLAQTSVTSQNEFSSCPPHLILHLCFMAMDAASDNHQPAPLHGFAAFPLDFDFHNMRDAKKLPFYNSVGEAVSAEFRSMVRTCSGCIAFVVLHT